MRLLKYLFLAPVAALILVFAFANREWVTINFDPTGLSGLAPMEAPEFLVLLITAAFGVVAGGMTTWIGQGRHRRAARDAQTEAARLRAELQAARLGPAAPLARQA
jgi:membrane protein YqaA with SNARE-associated domain